MSSLAFRRLATRTCSVRRSTMTSGVGQTPASVITGLLTTPIDPVSSETQRRLNLNSGYEMYECFCDSEQDIRKGDVLIENSVSYIVHAAEKWEWRGDEYVKIVLEKSAPLN